MLLNKMIICFTSYWSVWTVRITDMWKSTRCTNFIQII